MVPLPWQCELCFSLCCELLACSAGFEHLHAPPRFDGHVLLPPAALVPDTFSEMCKLCLKAARAGTASQGGHDRTSMPQRKHGCTHVLFSASLDAQGDRGKGQLPSSGCLPQSSANPWLEVLPCSLCSGMALAQPAGLPNMV